MARYQIDSDRSTVSAVARPALGHDPGPSVASVAGTVEVVDDHATGSIIITLEGHPAPCAEIDLGNTRAEVATDADGGLVLRGRTSCPAGVFGLTGPPMLNPTVLLRWILVLTPI